MRKDTLLLTKPQLVFGILLCESVLLYLFAPHFYSYGFNLFCLIQYTISAAAYIIVQKKRNYFDFDVIFLLTYFFIMFFFPVFMYGTDLEKVFFAFQYDYNHDVISRASALSLMGAQAYMSGGLALRKSRIHQLPAANQRIIPNNILSVSGLICFGIFFVAAGPELFSHTYDGTIGGESASSAVSYILVLLNAILGAALVIEFNNWSIDKNYHRNWLLFLILFFFIIVFVAIGSRGSPLQFTLLVLGVYALKIKSISFKQVLLLTTMGIVALGAFGLMRAKGSADSLRETAGPLVFLQDLILNNRNTFMAIDLVDKNGLDFGTGMLTPILGVIPFMNSMVLTVTPLTPLDMSSGLRITAASLNTNSDFHVGFGTNIIADIYMSFGAVGVISLMFVLGFMVKYAMFKSIYQKNIYYLLFYGILMSYSVFIVRAEYFFFLRPLVWGLMIVNVVKLHQWKLTLRIRNSR